MYFGDKNYEVLNSKKDINTCISGASEVFNVLSDEHKLKIDIFVQTNSSPAICGQIKDENGIAVSKAFVKLVKARYINKNIEYINIAKCISDDEGFYQFNINPSNDDSAYKIIVSKNHIEQKIL